MINFFKTKMSSTFTFLDYGFLKLYGAIAGAIFGAFFPEIIKSILIPLLVVFVIIGFRYLYLLFIKKTD